MRYKKPSNRRTGGYVGMEVKFFDSTYIDSVKTPSTATLANNTQNQISNIAAHPKVPGQATVQGALNCPLIGNSITNRDGRQIYMKSVHVSGTLWGANISTRAVAAGMVPYTVVIALILDTQTNAATNDLSTVFLNPLGALQAQTSAGAIPGCASPLPNLQYRTRYRILKLKRVTLKTLMTEDGTAALVAFPPTLFSMSHKFRGKGLVTNFIGATSGGTAADIADNGLYVAAWVGFDPAASGGGVLIDTKIQYNSRVRFVG